MTLTNIINKLKSLFVKPEPKVEAPIVEVKLAETKSLLKKALKKFQNKQKHGKTKTNSRRVTRVSKQ